MKTLSSSLLLARIRGMEIRFHFSILFSIPITYYLFHPIEMREYVITFSWLAGFILCILLHELGHAITAQIFGMEVKSIHIWLLGGFTNLNHKADEPSYTFAISAAGPLVNTLLVFLCVVFYIIFSLFLSAIKSIELFLWVESFRNLFFSLALLNLALIFFNLLPIFPLDGGNILNSSIEMLFGKSNADKMTLIIGAPVLACLFAFGIYTRDYLLVISCLLIALALSTLNHSFLHRANLGINYLAKRSAYYYLQGDYERAIQHYTRDIEKEPRQPSHYLARAACLLNILQKERAKADIERALNIAPNNPLALQLRGEMYMLDKDYNHALDFFNRSLEVNANWAIPYFDRGSILLEQKNYQLALIEFDKSITLLPQFYLAYLIRSIVHFRLGNLESAHKDQDAALVFSEHDALVMTELNLSIYENCLDWAEDYYMHVLRKKPDLGYAHQGRADAYRINNEHNKAITNYTNAIKLIPKEPHMYLGRGRSYQALNEIEKAKSDFETALMLTDKIHLKYQSEELLKNL